MPREQEPTAPTAGPGAARGLALALIDAGEAIAFTLARIAVERGGIGFAERRVLAALVGRGEATARTVAADEGLHKTMVSRAVAALIGKGLVERRPNRADLREAFLTATEKGRQADRLIGEAEKRLEALLAAGLDPAERIGFERTLAGIAAAVAPVAAADPVGDGARRR
ncbi:MarR family winged helix-turn-helix transcriptional regulator [Prosthecodimorpha staleyi]|uniref:MarR family winged helix-turn-helix transcriptional regulator n=1 Tax=Prosthecodimorpha staleyi TaxID=2840188 RepID=A0A947D9E9_9HYPH|nr:MarR family winged helix-turn-helix transcriptional regulator [Prosthecodimorpha staleyi]MBT9292539.1 MarR family winged helix-turn-helix transcriptional regulator [Prosthecodimorpha staleyi]